MSGSEKKEVHGGEDPIARLFEMALEMIRGAGAVFDAEASRRALERGERIGRLGTEALEPLTRCLGAWSLGEADPEAAERLQEAVAAFGRGLLQETVGRQLDLPPLGPAREAQLSLQRAAEAYARLTETTAGFAGDFSRPLAQALNRMPAVVEERAGDIASADDLYQALRELLDKEYQGYLGSPKGVQQVAALVDRYLDFRKHLDEALAPLLKLLGLPTREDMDEVYARLHRVKKAQRGYEARLEDQAAAIGALQKEIRALTAGASSATASAPRAAPAVKRAPRGRKRKAPERVEKG